MNLVKYCELCNKKNITCIKNSYCSFIKNQLDLDYSFMHLESISLKCELIFFNFEKMAIKRNKENKVISNQTKQLISLAKDFYKTKDRSVNSFIESFNLAIKELNLL